MAIRDNHAVDFDGGVDDHCNHGSPALAKVIAKACSPLAGSSPA